CDPQYHRADQNSQRRILILLYFFAYRKRRDLDDDKKSEREKHHAQRRVHNRHLDLLRINVHYLPPWKPECQKWNERYPPGDCRTSAGTNSRLGVPSSQPMNPDSPYIPRTAAPISK